MLEFLPDKLRLKLNGYNDKNLSELRIRADKNLSIIYKGSIVKLNVKVTLKDIEGKVIATEKI
jgi:stage III sporulation protein SpoIIIAA